MKVVHTCVRVRDIDASLRFYEALGFERRGKLQFETAYNIYMGLPGDGDTLELTVNEGREEPYDLGDGYGHMAHRRSTTSTPVVAELADQGIEPEKPPYHPGGREELGPICFVPDPDGYRIELIDGEEFPTPQDELARGEVPQPVDAGREVVLAAAHRDHARQRAAEERRAAGDGHLVTARRCPAGR